MLDEARGKFSLGLRAWRLITLIAARHIPSTYCSYVYGKQLIGVVLRHPSLQKLRRFMLATSDAHGLYERFGFTAPQQPQTLMERYFPNIYLS